jgi:SAM-dependent methyltransferase
LRRSDLTRGAAILVRRLVHLGLKRYCPACGSHTRRFGSYGSPPRPDAKCLVCQSSERERAQVLLLRRKIWPLLGVKTPVRVLHVAPEAGIARVLRGFPAATYVSGDIETGRAMTAIDLTKLSFSDDSLDFIFVSHVLEHIGDDARAIAELYRVLAPSGVAFVEVPVLRATTYEDGSVTDPAERRKEFGQEDHVRICGLDYVERLQKPGFTVAPLWIDEQFTSDEIQGMRLRIELTPELRAKMPARYEQHHHIAWLCTKPARS